MRLELQGRKPGAGIRPSLARIWEAKGRPSPAQRLPRPDSPRGRRDSRPSAAPAGPSSCCPGARRQVSASQVSASQVSGRKWRPAGRAEGAGGADGGGRRPRARRSVRGHGRLRRAAPCGPAGAARSKSGSRAGAGAQRRSARRARPSPAPRPALLLKGPSAPAAPARAGAGGGGGAGEKGGPWGAPPLRRTAAQGRSGPHRTVPRPAAR